MGVGGLNRRGGGAAEKLDFTIDSDTEQGREVRERILDSAKRHGFAGDAFFALTVALEEAVINAIRHGNRFDRNKKVRVNAKISAKKVEIMVEDEGPGFDRSSVPDPTAMENLEKCSGRGILLIEAYMNGVSWDRGGRRIRLVKKNQ